MKEFKRIEPLSNFQIIEKCEDLKIKHFRGVFMRDELKNSKQNECLVINTDHSQNEGTHWTCLYIKNGISYYFDPYGFPPTPEVINYCNDPRNYSSFPIQRMDEVNCGHYCIHVLHRLDNGDEFYDICFDLFDKKNFCYCIMSVNIFGSFIDGNNTYVDQKFTTLSTNLASKVEKFGDVISGDLNLLVNNDSLRTFGVSDLSSGKSMSLLLGDQDNQMRHNHGHSLIIAALHGTKFTCPVADICKIGSENDTRMKIFQDVVMSNKFIAGLRDPFSAQDAATKNYTDNNDNLRVLKTGDTMTGNLSMTNSKITDLATLSELNDAATKQCVDAKCVKNNIGCIPNQESNNSMTGFIATSSDQMGPGFQPYGAFSNLKADYSWATTNTTGWLAIQCPNPVKLWKVALKA